MFLSRFFMSAVLISLCFFFISPVSFAKSHNSNYSKNREEVLTTARLKEVDINTADASLLETLKGIGPKRAQAILKYRKEYGPFKSVDELVNVHGIGKKFLVDLKNKNRDTLVAKSAR